MEATLTAVATSTMALPVSANGLSALAPVVLAGPWNSTPWLPPLMKLFDAARENPSDPVVLASPVKWMAGFALLFAAKPRPVMMPGENVWFFCGGGARGVKKWRGRARGDRPEHHRGCFELRGGNKNTDQQHHRPAITKAQRLTVGDVES